MKEVPNTLRKAFVIHFWADWIFAAPLMLMPNKFLGLMGWEQVDPFTARIVAAALIGIGTESLLGRNGSVDHYRGMLRLKIIWSSAAIGGIAWTMAEIRGMIPIMAWAILGIFVLFNALWVFWWRRLKKD
jgi:hypothetical protein